MKLLIKKHWGLDLNKSKHRMIYLLVPLCLYLILLTVVGLIRLRYEREPALWEFSILFLILVLIWNVTRLMIFDNRKMEKYLSKKWQ